MPHGKRVRKTSMDPEIKKKLRLMEGRRPGFYGVNKFWITNTARRGLEQAWAALGQMGQLDGKFGKIWDKKQPMKVNVIIGKLFGDYRLAVQVFQVLASFRHDTFAPGTRRAATSFYLSLADQKPLEPDPFPGLAPGPSEEPCHHCGGIGFVARVRVPEAPPEVEP